MDLHMVDPRFSLSGLLVGLLVGLTGVGGGSLMTPLLVLVFGIHPATAVGYRPGLRLRDQVAGQWGGCWLACHLWNQLQLDEFGSPRLAGSVTGDTLPELAEDAGRLWVDQSARQRVAAASAMVRTQCDGRSCWARTYGAGADGQSVSLHDKLLATRPNCSASCNNAGRPCSRPNLKSYGELDQHVLERDPPAPASVGMAIAGTNAPTGSWSSSL